MEAPELASFKRGDEWVFRALIDRYSPRLLHIASSYSDGFKDPHDLVQEIWIRVFEKRGSYSGEGSLSAWIFGVSRNVCLEYARNEMNRADLREDRGSQVKANTLGQPNPPPDRAVAERELHQRVLEATGTLSTKEFEVVTRRVFGEERLSEIAGDWGAADGTVRSLFHRALKKMRSTLDRSVLE